MHEDRAAEKGLAPLLHLGEVGAEKRYLEDQIEVGAGGDA